MTVSASFETLERIPRAILLGAIYETAAPAWEATYERKWERDARTWKAVLAAIEATATGRTPSQERSKAPAWLQGVVRRRLGQLSTRWTQSADFLDIRLLERLGLVELEHDDEYVLAMVGSLGDRRGAVSRVAALRDDPELLAGPLWRIFEVEGGGEISLANIDKFSAEAASWHQTWLALVQQHVVDRSRVLRECLAALARDFSAYRAGWYARMYDGLAPTLDEVAAGQETLIVLLRSHVGATVSFAARHIREVNADGLLRDDLVAQFRPGLVAKAKTPAIHLLDVLRTMTDRRPDIAPAVTDLVCAALEHPSADVQRTAATLLRDLGRQDLAEKSADMLAPSVRKLLNVKPTPEARRPATPQAPVAPAVRPRAESLVDVLSGLLEDASDPIRIEQAIRGLAQRPDEGELRPLAKRARAILAAGPRETVVPGWLRGQLARLALQATGERPVALPPVRRGTQLLEARLEEVSDVLVGARQPFTPLAWPEDSSGRVDIDRVLAELSRSQGSQVGDLVAAAHRVAPDQRRRLLAALPRLRTHARAARKAAQEPQTRADVVLSSRTHSWSDARGTRTSTWWTWTIQAPGVVEAEGIQEKIAASLGLADWVPWISTVWPYDLERFLLHTASPVFATTQDATTSPDVAHVLNVLTGRNAHLGRLAAVTTVAALAAAAAEVRVLGVDLVAAAVPARLSVPEVARAMISVAPAVVLTRWAGSLAEVTRLSGPAQRVVAQVLAETIPGLAHDTRGLSSLLETLHEATIDSGVATSNPDLLKWLEVGASTAGGKTRHLCKELVAMTATGT